MKNVNKEKYLAELDMTLTRTKFLINTLSNECNDNDLKTHLSTIQDIRENVRSKIKGETSTCCNAPVKRGTKIAGRKPYCTKCNKECEVENS